MAPTNEIPCILDNTEINSNDVQQNYILLTT